MMSDDVLLTVQYDRRCDVSNVSENLIDHCCNTCKKAAKIFDANLLSRETEIGNL